MTRTLYTIDDIGGALDWASLHFFVYGLMRDPTSMVFREFSDDREIAGWLDGTKVAPLLADVYDLLQWTRHSIMQVNSKRKVKQPKPYPRPWVRGDRKVIGSGAVAIAELQDWWDAQPDESQEDE